MMGKGSSAQRRGARTTMGLVPSGYDPMGFDREGDYRVFHGTTLDMLPGIEAEGLRPSPWGPTLATWRPLSENAARDNAAVSGQRAVLLQFRIPRSVLTRYVEPNEHGVPGDVAHRVLSPIPARYIAHRWFL